jgi:acetoacetyl-CoA reductase
LATRLAIKENRVKQGEFFMTKRIALVTGGMGGIGQATCRELYKLGAHVIAGYSRAHQKARDWQSEQKKAGFDFGISYGDVASFDACLEMVKQIESTIGPIDILVNNAGITRDHTCCKMSKEDWDSVINVDLNSVFYMTRAVINRMKERNYGRIINISSINGQKGQYGQVNYSAAKAGIHGFTKALALEVAKNHITVNTVSPGYVETDMLKDVPIEVKQKILADIPIGRFATPDEIAHLIAFLAEDKNEYITGANIAINGGHYMS